MHFIKNLAFFLLNIFPNENRQSRGSHEGEFRSIKLCYSAYALARKIQITKFAETQSSRVLEVDDIQKKEDSYFVNSIERKSVFDFLFLLKKS